MLINQDFTWLWTGQTVSLLGTLIYDCTIMLWFATDLLAGRQGAPLASSAVLIVAAVVALLVGPAAGVLADRWNKRRTMIASDLFRAALLSAFAVVVWLPREFVGLTWLIALALVTATLNTVAAQLFSPARNVLIGDVVPADRRGEATGYGQATTALSGILGPTLAAPLLVFAGPQWAVTANAASFLVSAALVGLVRPPVSEDQPARAGSARAKPSPRLLLAELVVGLRCFAKVPTLRTVLTTIMIALLGAGAILVVDVYFLSANLGASPSWFGLLTGAFGAGVLIGSLVFGRIGDRIGHTRVFCAGVLTFGASIMLYAKQTTLAPALVLIAVYGIALGAANTSITPLVLATVPRAVQGRVWSVFGVANQLAALVSMAVAAGLIASLSPTLRYSVLGVGFGRLDTVLFVAGIMIFAAGGYAWVALRRAPTMPDPAAPTEAREHAAARS